MKASTKIGTEMTPFPHWVEAEESIDHAKAMMREHGVRHLPVQHAGELVGVVSERDIERAQLLGIGLRGGELSVRQVCAPDPYIVPFDAPLGEVLEQMAARAIGSAVVTHHDKLAGIFTTVDACRAFARSLVLTADDDQGGGAA